MYMYAHTHNTFVHTDNIVDGLTASRKTIHCAQYTSATFVYMLYYALYFSMLIMRSHGVSTAVKRDTVNDI